MLRTRNRSHATAKGKKMVQRDAGKARTSTYPQNKISRTNTYRSHFEACHSVGTDTDNHTSALVGRSTQANAASNSDRRNLHEYEHEPKVVAYNGAEHCKFDHLL